MKRRDLSNSRVVITGAGSGIGRALAFRFARAGCRLALLDKDTAALEDVVNELQTYNVEVLQQPGDVTHFEDCRRLVEGAIEAFGGVDVLINNAGITHRSAFIDTTPEVFHRVMAVNYFGAMHCTKAALPSLIENKGVIIVLSSVAGFAPLIGRTGYSAAKHALHGLFESLRTELHGSGVHIMLVCPAFIATNIEKNALGEDGKPTNHPQSRIGKSLSPEYVADSIFKAAEKEKRLLLLSTVGKLSYYVMKFSPLLYEKIMQRSLQSELDRD